MHDKVSSTPGGKSAENLTLVTEMSEANASDLKLVKITSVKQVLDVKPQDDNDTINRIVILKRHLSTNVQLVDVEHYEEDTHDELMEHGSYIHDFEEISWTDPFENYNIYSNEK